MIKQYYSDSGISIPPPPRRPPPRVSYVPNPEAPRTRFNKDQNQLVRVLTETADKSVISLTKEPSIRPIPSSLNAISDPSSQKLYYISSRNSSVSTQSTPRLQYPENSIGTSSVKTPFHHYDSADLSRRGDLPTALFEPVSLGPRRTEVSPDQMKENAIIKERSRVEVEEWRSSHCNSREPGSRLQDTPTQAQIHLPNGPGGGTTERGEPSISLLTSGVGTKENFSHSYRAKMPCGNRWSNSPTTFGGNRSQLRWDSSPSFSPPTKRSSIELNGVLDRRESAEMRQARRENLLSTPTSKLHSTYQPYRNSIVSPQKSNCRTEHRMLSERDQNEERFFDLERTREKNSADRSSLLEDDWNNRLQALLLRPELREMKIQRSNSISPDGSQPSGKLKLEGVEILPQKPNLQSTHNTVTNRYVQTLQRFKNLQTAQTQGVLEKLLQQYSGKEDLLCAALSLLFMEEFREFSFTTRSKSRSSSQEGRSPERLAPPVAHCQARPPLSSSAQQREYLFSKSKVEGRNWEEKTASTMRRRW